MLNLALLNFILYNFLQNHIKWAVILNCWNSQTSTKLTELLMAENIYVQLWQINHMNIQNDIEGPYLNHKHTHEGVFFDLNCLKSEEVLNKTSEEKLFKDHLHWLIFDDSSNVTKFRHLFANFNMAVDADVTYAFPNRSIINSERNSSFVTYDVYNNGLYLGGKLNMTLDREIICSLKECHLKAYLSSLHEKAKYVNRWYLNDITMRVATVVTHLPVTDPPEKLLAYLGSDKNMHTDAVARFGFGYLLILKETLGCQFRHNFTHIWSRTETTGGTVGAMIDQSADLTSTPFLHNKIRFPYVQPTMPMGNFRQVCIFRTPRNAGIRSEVYLEPFSSIVWILFAAILLLIGATLWFTFVVEWRQLKIYLDFLPSLLTSCLISFGSACCQGSFVVPSSIGGRMVFFSLSLLTFIIYNYYTSIVVAILLGSPVKSNIKTIDQLAESNLEVAMELTTYTRTFLNITPRSDIRSFVRNKIQTRKDPESIWMPIKTGLSRVRDDPGFVYITEAFSSYALIENSYMAEQICDINEILFRPEQTLYEHVHRNSSYLEYMKLKQIRIFESGIHRRYEGIWVKKRLNCYLTSGSLVQVGLEYTAPLFIMLVSVYCLVFILVVLEICWFKYLEGIEVMKRLREGLE